MAKFEREYYCVRQLTAALSLPADLQYSDPLKDYGRETGIDVIMLCSGHKIGFQVTEYDGGENIVAVGAGRMRAAETRSRREARNAGVYGGWGSPHFEQAFAARVAEKARKSRDYNFAEIDQIWLLVTAGLPDAPISTFVPDFHIGTEILNDATDTSLAASRYHRAFLHIIMHDALYGWRQQTGWRKLLDRRRELRSRGYQGP